MKKIILGLIIGLLLISCSNILNDVSKPEVYKWQFKLDGVLYQWSGGLYDEAGRNSYHSSSKKLQLAKNNMTITILFPNASTGNFTFVSPSSNDMTLLFQYTNMDWDIYDTHSRGIMNVNVSYLSPTSYESNPSNPGKVKGTFSGTLDNPGGQISTITDGMFEVVRMQ